MSASGKKSDERNAVREHVDNEDAIRAHIKAHIKQIIRQISQGKSHTGQLAASVLDRKEQGKPTGEYASADALARCKALAQEPAATLLPNPNPSAEPQPQPGEPALTREVDSRFAS
jgi:hypothetical protein